jgi:aldose 1-epimerase
MYKITKSHFGQLEQLTIQSPDGSDRFSVVPAYGNTIMDLQLAGQADLLDVYQTEDELLHYQWMKNALLFPFPNRLKNGTYIWNNDTYYFHINDAITNNALHGFGMDKAFEVIAQRATEHSAGITCRYEYNGDLDAYPFPFTVEVDYELDGPGSFSVTMRFYNDGHTAIPVGLGWHPYFQLGDDISKLQLKLPACQMIGIDKHMIPTGKKYDYEEFETLRKIGATILDNGFALRTKHPDEDGMAEALLESDTAKLRYWQQTGPNQYNFLQVFTHPERHAIALEPMSCNIDAFNNGDGLVTLLPNERMEVRCGVVVMGK